ncbi:MULTISPECIES: DUF2064 domain-containing protein [unclassified Mycolicibacterium]|uniref:TIGR04282 family arsenosugar biosynthesis glycosyltransferase n=1 Tax=unclassified Mycolicibacterium TaxID=2636767 RepID=UPI001F4C2449|nr:DUF2064 domain-containing protein [Mycolicibacterium sp. YH-1]UNB51673.1 DUF2064 domain-containing protein [Mycolicibacterium sp. YH-1]
MTLQVTLLVVAKAPVPGLAKTRLARNLGAQAAADVAAAALLDTLDAVADTPVVSRVVALTGDLSAACRGVEITQRLTGFRVVEQRGADFAERLANAHTDASRACPGLPVLQIGMDTPQVSDDLLAETAVTLLGTDAVLGMATDGGWWVLGVSTPSLAQCLRDVPMSTSDTGALTLAALRDAGAEVELVRELADVDTIEDLAAVRRVCRPDGRFHRASQAAGV